jgi:hypothetical protein
MTIYEARVVKSNKQVIKTYSIGLRNVSKLLWKLGAILIDNYDKLNNISDELDSIHKNIKD